MLNGECPDVEWWRFWGQFEVQSVDGGGSNEGRLSVEMRRSKGRIENRGR